MAPRFEPKQPTESQESNSKQKLYQCQIDITFPTPQHAMQAKEVLEVDRELGDQITKTFQVTHGRKEPGSGSTAASSENGKMEGGGVPVDVGGELANVLSIHIRATEAKLLRVAISSFYDMLNIYLKCHQEFS